jgi:hypothetical protein
MKHSISHSKFGFTQVELLVSIFCFIILFGCIILLTQPRHRKAATRISCVNNLKQIGIAFRIWAGDHNDKYPSETSQADGGLYEALTNTGSRSNCWKIFNVMFNELGQNPLVLLCPSDVRQLHSSAQNTPSRFFIANTNISYFTGIGANDTLPQTLLAGDRNLAPGLISSNDFGYSHADGSGNDVTLSTNSTVSPICWSLNMHSQGKPISGGNILLGDCSVQQSSSMSLRTQIQPFAGASFVMNPDNNAQPTNTFRLLFP